MDARSALALALEEQLSFTITDDLTIVDSLLAWLWLHGYKLVPLGDEDGPGTFAQIH